MYHHSNTIFVFVTFDSILTKYALIEVINENIYDEKSKYFQTVISVLLLT